MPSSLFNPVDKKTGAAISEDNAISELGKGNVYTFNYANLTATAATVIKFLYRVGSKRTILDVERQAIGGGIVTIQLYENPTVVSVGTVISTINKNRVAKVQLNKTAEMLVSIGANATPTGATILDTGYIFVTATGESNKTTSSSNDNIPWVLNPNTNYLAITTFSGNTAFSAKGEFIELDNEPEEP